MDERKISIDDVEYTIMHGEIIEEYPADYPYPSCLVLCAEVRGRPIHIVISSDGELINLITAYVPDAGKWTDNFSKREVSNMKCMSCKGEMEASFTTDVTERDGMLIIIKNVPCYKCMECTDVFYTGDVVAVLERLRKKTEDALTELTIINYSKVA